MGNSGRNTHARKMAKDENYDEENQAESESFNIWWAISGVGYALAILFLVMFFMKGGDAKLQEQVKSLQAQVKSLQAGKTQAGPAAANLKALIKGQEAWRIEEKFSTKQSQNMFFHLIGASKNMGQLTNLVKLFGKAAREHFQKVVVPEGMAEVTADIKAYYKDIHYEFVPKPKPKGKGQPQPKGLELAPIVPGRKMTGANMNDFDRIAVYFQYMMQSNKGTYAKYATAAGATALAGALVTTERKLYEFDMLKNIVSDGTYLGWGYTVSFSVILIALLWFYRKTIGSPCGLFQESKQ